MSTSEDDLLPKVAFSFRGPGSWRVRRFVVHEQLGQPYRVVLDLVSEEADPDLKSLLGAACTLEIARGSLLRKIHGIAFRVENLGTSGEHTLVQLSLAPALFGLGHIVDTRIFQSLSAPDIIHQVLEKPLAAYHREQKARLSGAYPVREYCLQYQESDLAFVQRLMAEEGLSYFFEHDGEAEVMVLVDGNNAYPTCPTLNGGAIPVASQTAASGQLECVSRFSSVREIGPTRLVVHEFDWTRPSVDLTKQEELKQDDRPDFEVYEHAPADALTDYSADSHRYGKEHVQARAKVGLERLQVRQSTHHGESNITGLGAGSVFETTESLLAELNQEYLVLRIHSVGQSPEDIAAESDGPAEESFRNDFECIPVSTVYRPPREGVGPRIPSMVTATVVGPSGEEIFTDIHGRVRVQFHWDRLGARDDKSSCWVRVVQSWAGPGWGALFIPRIGMEVVVQFVNGNPDRPVITGCLYNGDNAPPYALPDEKTKSTIRTASSPGSNGYNEIRFEDAKDSEELFFHAQKDMNEVVEHDHTVTIHNDERRVVDQNQTEEIGADQTLTVTGNREKVVEGNEDREVQGNRTTEVKKNESLMVGGSRDGSVAGCDALQVDKDQSLAVKGSRSTTITKDEDRSIEGKRTTTIKGDEILSVKEKISITGDKQVQVQQGKTTMVFKGDKLDVTAGGAITIVHDSGTIKIDGSGNVKIEGGSKVEILAGSASVKLSGGNVVVKGSKVGIN